MLQNIIFMCFYICLAFYWHAPETVYNQLPQVAQRGHVAQHVVVGKTESVARGARDAPIGKHAPMLLGARYFLGLAVMPVCEDRVVPRARNGVHVWGPVTWCSRNNVGADLWGPGYSWGSHQRIGILNQLQERGDANV